jgi:hypothetical protein
VIIHLTLVLLFVASAIAAVWRTPPGGYTRAPFTFFAFVFLVGALLTGCSTVTPKLLPPPAAAAQTVTKVSGGFIITAEQRDKYNALIALGYGTPAHHILPPLKKDDGLKPLTSSTWWIDDEHATDFAEMNLLFRSGIKP